MSRHSRRAGSNRLILNKEGVAFATTPNLWYHVDMSPKLTDEMRSALEQQPGKPVTVEDDQTHIQYVLLPIDIYQKVQALVGDEPFDIRETYAAQDQALSKVWNDPDLDVYNADDANKPQS